MRTYIKQLFREPEKYVFGTVTVCGWVRTVRDNKNLGFIQLNDGSFFKNVQIVFDNSLPNFAETAKMGVGTCIMAEGEFVESQGAKQPYEIKASKVTVLGESPEDYPLQKKRHSMEYLRQIAHLRPRTNTFSAVFRVRSTAAFAIHKFFNERGFVYCHSPIITAADAEGAGEMFSVTTFDMKKLPPLKDGKEIDYSKDFFGRSANLTVTGQLNAETFALAFGNTYTFGPTFRAENSNTTRHAAEFWMIEPEMAFADLSDNMDVMEDMLKYVIKYVMNECPEEMEFFNEFIDKGVTERLKNVANSEFRRITYTEAVEILEKSGQKFEFAPKWGMDIQTEHERYLAEKHFKAPVFVTDYPKEIKAFYMRLNDDKKTVAACDCLVPGIGEIIGGSQREERLDVLEDMMKEKGLNPEDYWWYLELRKYGGVYHSGFGLGFERFIMYITGIQNIRDVIPFPRTVRNCEF